MLFKKIKFYLVLLVCLFTCLSFATEKKINKIGFNLPNDKGVDIDTINDWKFAEKIYEGVTENLDDINKVLKASMRKKVKIINMDKLLISIFRSAIYEILFSNDASKKIVISEYLLIANRFFGNNETALINGVLDNLQNS